MNYKLKNKIRLKDAVKFHGHLGPYLVLGLRAGELALKKLKAKKYFGLDVLAWGVNRKPKSCLIDGLQLSTGATYGKGNIRKLNSSAIKVEFHNCVDGQKITLRLTGRVIQKLKEAKTHRDSELLAKELYKAGYSQLFNLRL
jgi:formylmethanofuran dehydrogenase subunit E